MVDKSWVPAVEVMVLVATAFTARDYWSDHLVCDFAGSAFWIADSNTTWPSARLQRELSGSHFQPRVTQDCTGCDSCGAIRVKHRWDEIKTIYRWKGKVNTAQSILSSLRLKNKAERRGILTFWNTLWLRIISFFYGTHELGNVAVIKWHTGSEHGVQDHTKTPDVAFWSNVRSSEHHFWWGI